MTYIFCAVWGLVMTCLLAWGVVLLSRPTQASIGTGAPTGRIVGYRVRTGQDFHDGGGEPDSYAPEYVYEVDGQHYRGLGSYSWFKVGEVGTLIALRIDPVNPARSMPIKPNNKNRVAGFMLVIVAILGYGAMIALVPILMLMFAPR